MWLMRVEKIMVLDEERSERVVNRDTNMAKSMRTPLLIRGFGSLLDRCIKTSTQPSSLYRQTLAVEWAVLKNSDFQRAIVVGFHLSNKSVHQFSALL